MGALDTLPVRLTGPLHVPQDDGTTETLPVGFDWTDATIDDRGRATVPYRRHVLLLPPSLYEVVPEDERDLDRCEVDDCDSTDDVQAELLSWGNRIDPPEYLYVCAHHRALQDAALEHLAEDRAADRAYGYDDPSLDYR